VIETCAIIADEQDPHRSPAVRFPVRRIFSTG
jgi:hypothetical protein